MNPQFNLQPISTLQDGNCFYHSFLQVLNQSYTSKDDVLTFKQNLSNLLTVESAIELIPEEIQIQLSTIFQTNKELSTLIETNFLHSIHHPIINNILNQVINHFKLQLKTDGIWADDWAQKFCSRVNKVNTIAYLNTCNKFQPIFTPNPEWPCIILINLNNSHWESSILIISFKNDEKNDDEKNDDEKNNKNIIVWKHPLSSLKHIL